MRVLIVDRKPLFRDALAALVRSLIAGLDVLAVSSVAEAAPLMGQFQHGLLILEAEQVGRDQFLAAIRLVHPGWRIALLGGPALSTAALHIDGHLGTDADSGTVIAEVRRLVGAGPTRPAQAAGQSGLPLPEAAYPAAAGGTGRRAAVLSSPGRSLTHRQREVLQLLAQGRSTKDIARALDLGIGTIKAHLDAIYRTLGVHSRIAAVARAQQFSATGSGGQPLPVAGSDNVIQLGTHIDHRRAGSPAGPPPTFPSTAAR